MLPEHLQRFAEPIKVLDKGFIRVVDIMGDNADEAAVQAARVSYGEGTKTINKDRGLIRYLLSHHHTTPFEMAEVKFHVKLPIFVARQWIRHRTANVNEYSARYSIVKNEFYVPEMENIAGQSTTNKQGRSDEVPSEEQAAFYERFRKHTIEAGNALFSDYNMFVDNEGELDISRELARMNLPLNTYTEWYWKCDLHNVLNFLRLRADKHAQFEIVQYANVMAEFVKVWAPHTFEAFTDYVLEAGTFSRMEMKIIREVMNNVSFGLGFDYDGMSDREIKEFIRKIGK